MARLIPLVTPRMRFSEKGLNLEHMGEEGRQHTGEVLEENHVPGGLLVPSGTSTPILWARLSGDLSLEGFGR